MRMRIEPPTHRLLGVDIEAQHGATWSAKYDGRLFFGAAMRFEDRKRASYLPPRAPVEDFEVWCRPLFTPGVVVVAHNGRYDLEGINGERIRLGLSPLPEMLLSDTLKDGYKTGSMMSRTLGDLCAALGINAKGSVSRYQWEEAYRGEPWALALVKDYNLNDVECLFPLRAEMLKRGMLKYPYRTWRP